MEFATFGQWLGTSALVIVALIVTWFLGRWILDVAAAGKDAFRYIFNIIWIALLVAWFGWTGVDWFYGEIKTGASESVITSDITGVFGQAPSDLGIGGSGDAGVSDDGSSGGQAQPTQAPVAQQPICNEIAQPADISLSKQMSWKGVGEIVAWRCAKVGDQWVFNQLVKTDGTAVPSIGVPGKFKPAPASVDACNWVTPPQPTAMPAPTPMPLVLAAKCALAWADWSELVGLSTTSVQYGTGIAPIGVNCTMQGGATMASKDNEKWYLSCAALNIVKYKVNGHVGRSTNVRVCTHRVCSREQLRQVGGHKQLPSRKASPSLSPLLLFRIWVSLNSLLSQRQIPRKFWEI